MKSFYVLRQRTASGLWHSDEFRVVPRDNLIEQRRLWSVASIARWIDERWRTGACRSLAMAERPCDEWQRRRYATAPDVRENVFLATTRTFARLR